MVEQNLIIKAFPKLAEDGHFKITSPRDTNYNCIAWAFGMHKDRWMQPFPPPYLDGVHYWWPEGIRKGLDINAYIEAFQVKGFKLCDNYELEEKVLKIALYVNPKNGNCSHAARQKLCGTWMSKLGPQFDIEHGTPFTLEGDDYGKVYCCMSIKR